MDIPQGAKQNMRKEDTKMNTNLKEKLDAISQDTEYLKDLFEQDTPEKIQAKFAEKGIELTIDEVKDIIVKMVDYLKKALIYGHTSRISS